MNTATRPEHRRWILSGLIGLGLGRWTSFATTSRKRAMRSAKLWFAWMCY